jgi:hypothetical protein
MKSEVIGEGRNVDGSGEIGVPPEEILVFCNSCFALLFHTISS